MKKESYIKINIKILIFIFCFLTVLSISRFFSIRNYVKQRNLYNEEIKEIGYKNYLYNGVLLVLLDTYAKEYDLTQINGYTGLAVSLIISIIGLYMILNKK